MQWKIVDTGEASAEAHMAFDAELLHGLASSPCPVLHLYTWQGNSATYGHFIDPHQYLSSDGIAKHSLQLAKRPTGGGILFHLTDLAYSILLPAGHPGCTVNTLNNYAYVHRRVGKAIRQFLGKPPELLEEATSGCDPACCHFCMAQPTKYDLMWQGKKVGGGAQRRTRHGLLHQGTVALAAPDAAFLADILRHDAVRENMLRYGGALLPNPCDRATLARARQELAGALKAACANLWSAGL